MMLLPIISEEFNGVIWRIVIDALTGTIFVEVRNEQDKTVTFSALNPECAVVYFKQLVTDERWLTGIEAAYDGVLLLHYFQTESDPTHKGLLAIEAAEGKTLWSNYNYAFDHLTAHGPVVYDTRLQPRKLFLADIKTGATQSRYESSIHKELVSEILLPGMVDPNSLPDNLLRQKPFGNMVHYLDYNNFRIVSLHASNAGQLTQSVFIFSEGELVYEDLLNQNIKKIQPEAFMMHKNQLIYIKNKAELKVLSL
jgi:hypothetical protein